MARYADGLIADGEHILLRTRQHWFSIVAYTIAFWVLVLISIGFFLLGRVTNWEVFNWITLICSWAPCCGSPGATPAGPSRTTS